MKKISKVLLLANGYIGIEQVLPKYFDECLMHPSLQSIPETNGLNCLSGKFSVDEDLLRFLSDNASRADTIVISNNMGVGPQYVAAVQREYRPKIIIIGNDKDSWDKNSQVYSHLGITEEQFCLRELIFSKLFMGG
jgi:hypothetical protein